MSHTCDLCRGDGLYLKDNTRIFCDCPEGQRRKSAWILAGEIVQEEARKDQARRFHKMKRHDYKADAGGERMPGDDDDVPFRSHPPHPTHLPSGQGAGDH